jgi:Ca2+-dependent lipid-binding protein
MIEEDTKKANDIHSKLQEIIPGERLNSYGIMIGSILTVNVLEARDLRSDRVGGGICNPYVVLSLNVEEQVQVTDTIQAEANPVWNEVMTFDIQTGKEMLVAKVFDKSEYIGKDTLLGQCKITLD